MVIPKIPKTYLRKNRSKLLKYPYPYKTKWHFTFTQQQALKNLKNNKTSLNLNTLISSFASYNSIPTFESYKYLIKTLIEASRFKDLNLVLSHIEKTQNNDTPDDFFGYLISLYGKNGCVYDAIDVFLCLEKFGCVPSVLSLNALLVVLCEKIESLKFVPLVLMKGCGDFGVRLEGSSYLILIRGVCRLGRVDCGVKLFDCMVDDDCFEVGVGYKVCSLLLRSICRVDGVRNVDVMCVFERMKRVGFCPSRVDYRELIRFFVKGKMGRDAFDVLCEMKRGGIKPDIGCYTMVMRGLVEGGEFCRVEELFDEVLVFGLVPNVGTYNVYIDGLCRQNKIDVGLKMIGLMQGMGCEPNLVTYRTVLDAFCKVQELNQAREVWREIKQKGVEIDVRSYGIMIDALVDGGEVSDASCLFEEMLSNSFVLLSSSFDDIVCSLCCKGLAPEVLRNLEKACARGVALGNRAWEALVMQLKLDLDQDRDLLANLVDL